MNDLIAYLPLLNLLIVPMFMSYMDVRLRLKELEIHARRVTLHLGLDERRVSDD